jgi:hypothetical protein
VQQNGAGWQTVPSRLQHPWALQHALLDGQHSPMQHRAFVPQAAPESASDVQDAVIASGFSAQR